MEKCWFVLRQRHYPAPVYTAPGKAFGDAEGPIRLGHFVAGPKRLDQVLNPDAVTPFPRDMRIWVTETAQFRLSRREGRVHDNTVGADAPVAAAAGLTVDAEAGVVFRRLMGEEWEIDRLETQIVQPTSAYLEQCSRSEHLASWVERHKLLGTWKVYMISGIIVARGAKFGRNDGNEAGVHVSGEVDLFGAAGAKANIENKREKEVNISGQSLNDFVWAVRLTEVSKSLFQSNISQKTVTKGTVFASGPKKLDMAELLFDAGLAGENVHDLEVLQGEDPEHLIAIDEY
ncbi:hypothetical protein PG994_005198 [Apiospora phragmitis]|uniref:Uncharacterized protein n=1 Tax=Apiospora phragmitis TaxID=2905665 RepID=A0ABR1VWL6_9PEZI